jgi:hypothetical protein
MHNGRYWAPHNGRLPGSGLDLPFLAPADHFLELEGCDSVCQFSFGGAACASRPCAVPYIAMSCSSKFHCNFAGSNSAGHDICCSLPDRSMTQPKPEGEFGPHMDYREHSFLRNPRMPATVRRSRVRITICQSVGASPVEAVSCVNRWTCALLPDAH